MRMHTLSILLVGACLIASGCCGPLACGPGCGPLTGSCYDCEGGFGPHYPATGPIDALRQVRRSLVCGGGCGDVYYGEWTSTPPHCSDPCHGSDYSGNWGGYCRPFCWQPGALLSCFYGKRFDDCGGGCEPCLACDSCDASGQIMEGEVVSEGCANCTAQNQTMRSLGGNLSGQYASAPAADTLTRHQMATSGPASRSSGRPPANMRNRAPMSRALPPTSTTRSAGMLRESTTPTHLR